MSTQNFYQTLPALTNFLELTHVESYRDAPGDWYVLMTDIVGSTQAIEAGRYQDVNMLGAASIMAVLNAVRPLDIPFIFGGDGASMLVPPTHLQSAQNALLGLRHLARVRFGLELRVGVVPVALVMAHRALKIAKFRLTASYDQANFLGGGMTYASDLVKRDGRYRLDINHAPFPVDLTGLECRWQEIPSPAGDTVSLIVATKANGDGVQDLIYQEVLRAIQHIYGEALNYHPVVTPALKLSFNPDKLAAEVKARAPSLQHLGQIRYLLQILVENLLGATFMGLRLQVGEVDWGRYKADLRAASDYQKIDDRLHMVIASSPAQTQQLEHYLNQEFQAGQLAYGLHVSDRALMTCLILDRRHAHFHLIDGAGGGYALAAKALKSRGSSPGNRVE